tara:strand:+ start:1178 stop:1552 length:375 start_codon:yes stop_codon:yes gene_type:complete
MKKLFKNYGECESVIIKMCSRLTDESINKVRLAINVCESLMYDKDKIFRLTQTYLETLWDIPEAIEMGFHRYFRKEVNKQKKLLQYHAKHCPKTHECKVCQIMNKNINRLRNANERKRPELCLK